MKTIYAFIIALFGVSASYAQVECVDESLINPDILCTADWSPVCGCNGITYSNGCVAVNWGGVTSYTEGECGTMVCQDLTGLDFGECEMYLGIGLVNGECVPMSGCGWIVNNVDYSPYFFNNYDACFNACANQLECVDLSGLDFGMCDMWLGFALVNGSCVGVSGCGWTIGNTDYSPFFYNEIGGCMDACSSQIECVDVGGIDFGSCAMPLGYANINGECISISGCGWEVGGVDYSPYFYNEYFTCQTACQLGTCSDIGDVDFGDCDLALGYALQNGSCVSVSGCGWEVGGVNYASNFYTSYEMCVESCPSCINTLVIDLEYPVSPAESFVCGCNDVTYLNAEVAYYQHGVTTYSPGECGNNVGVIEPAVKLNVGPNPTDGYLVVTLNKSEAVPFRLYSIDGSIVLSGKTTGTKTTLDLTSLASGIYFLDVAGKQSKVVR